METKSCSPQAGRGTAAAPGGGRTLATNDVSGGSTVHNYRSSPARDRVAVAKIGDRGLTVIQSDGQTQEFPEVSTTDAYQWSPDGRGIAYLELGGVALEGSFSSVKYVDVVANTTTELYHTEGDLNGLEWSPDGEHVYFMEIEHHANDAPWFHLRKVDRRENKKVETLATTFDRMTFFNPPVSVFETGGLVTDQPYKVLYGTTGGLYWVSNDGRERGQIETRETAALENVEWSPSMDRFAAYFKYPPAGGDPGHRGLFLVRFRGRGGVTLQKILDLDDTGKNHVHSLWWAANGRHLGVGTPRAILIFDGDGRKETEAEDRDVTGFAWSRDGRRMAITAGRRVRLWKEESDALELVAEEQGDDVLFVADPAFLEAQVVYTVYRRGGAAAAPQTSPGQTSPGGK